MSQVKSDKSSSLPTNVSSPLRFEVISALTPSKRALQAPDGGDRYDDDSNTSPSVKRTRIECNSQPPLLRKMLTPTRSAMSETSNLFDHADIITQERLKSSYSSDIVFSSPIERKKDDDRPLLENDDEDDEDDLPLASFGWPGIPEEDNENEEEEVLTDRHARRSLLSELIQNDEPENDDDQEERQQSKKSFFNAVLGEQEDDWFPPPQNEHHHSSRLQQYDDQIDSFFSSSHVEDNIATERIPTSSLRRNYCPSDWQRIKPGYLRTQPRFLTSEYFKEHTPESCMEEEEEELYEDDDAQHQTQIVPYFEAKYTILGSLGSGEYAEVYKVEHVETGKQWAIKKTKGKFVSYDDR